MVKIKRLLIIFWVVGLCTCLHGQSAIPVSGGDVSGSGGTIDYSVGQIVYTTNSGSTGTVAQGVQLPYEISVTTAVDNTDLIILIFSIYPNPTNDFLMLKVGGIVNRKLSYNLYDINGNLLGNEKISGEQIQIDLATWVAGIYFLKVIENNKDLKTFKIVKK